MYTVYTQTVHINIPAKLTVHTHVCVHILHVHATHSIEGGLFQDGLVLEQGSVQVHEEGLDGVGIYSRGVVRTGGGGVRVQQ